MQYWLICNKMRILSFSHRLQEISRPFHQYNDTNLFRSKATNGEKKYLIAFVEIRKRNHNMISGNKVVFIAFKEFV